MSQSGEQLNHAIKKAWPYGESMPDVEARYLKVIQALIDYIGGEVTLSSGIFSESVDFTVEQNQLLGDITLRTAQFSNH